MTSETKGPGGEGLERLARTGREALRRLWERRDERGRLAPQELALLELLERHPEYRPFWEGAEPDETVNPFLHVLFHDVLRKQVADGEPVEAAETLRRLEAAGVDPHEAEHRVMNVLVSELFTMFRERRDFDQARYRERLKALDQ